MPVIRESHTVQQLREMILRGEFAPGERLTEAALTERLGLSRTPIRQALPILHQEGLLTPVGKRGFVVRAFTHQESLDALAVRAAMEGMAARAVAERGASADLIAALQACLADGDVILAKRPLEEGDEVLYGHMNDRFHWLIIEAAGMPLITEIVTRCERFPFVAARTIVFGEEPKPLAFDDLYYAHGQHRAIVDAIRKGDGARAELLFREHAATQRHSMSW